MIPKHSNMHSAPSDYNQHTCRATFRSLTSTFLRHITRRLRRALARPSPLCCTYVKGADARPRPAPALASPCYADIKGEDIWPRAHTAHAHTAHTHGTHTALTHAHTRTRHAQRRRQGRTHALCPRQRPCAQVAPTPEHTCTHTHTNASRGCRN